MDVDYKAGLNQILELHEHAIECQINKSVTSFQSLGITLTRENVCCFFDILSSRSVETCRKIQMSYLLSVHTVELVDESPSPGDILISVTSTPQCDSKGHSDIVTMDEDASTDEDEQFSSIHVSQTDQNDSADGAKTTDELETVDLSSDDHDTERIENAATVQTNGANDEPVSEIVSNTDEDAPVPVDVADGNDEIPSEMNVFEKDDVIFETTTVSLTATDPSTIAEPSTDSVTAAAPSSVSEINESECSSTATTTIDSPPFEKLSDNAEMDVVGDENPSRSHQDKQIDVDQEQDDPVAAGDAKSIEREQVAAEVPMPQHEVENFKPTDNDSSSEKDMEIDEDALHIDLGEEAQLQGDVTMADDSQFESTEHSNDKTSDDIVITSAANANTDELKADEAEDEIPIPIASANSSPVMSPHRSPPSTPIPSPNPTEQIEAAQHSVDTDFIPDTSHPVELNPPEEESSEAEPSEQESSQQVPLEQELLQEEPSEVELSQPEPSEQKSSEEEPSKEPSEMEEPSEQSESMSTMDSSMDTGIEPPPAAVIHAETEPELEPLECQSGQLHGEPLAETNSETGSDEQQLMLGFYEEAATKMIDNSLKRKDSPEWDVVCSAAKKSKPSEELESVVVAFSMNDHTLPVEPPNQAIAAAIPVPQEFIVPTNDNPHVHCQNAAYTTRCMICNQIDPSIINHYRIAHPNSDVFISRPAPSMVKRIKEKAGCKIFKDGKITAPCFFCEKSDTRTETEWRSHVLTHTGELEFFCTECRTQWAEKVQHGSCSIDSMTSVFDNNSAASTSTAAAAATTPNSDSSITLFMCKWCNYVQLHKAHIIRHLQYEHTTIDTNFNRNVEIVTFMPDLNPITWRLSFNYDCVSDKERFRCTYPKCPMTKSFRCFDDLEKHLHERHANETDNYTCPHCPVEIEPMKQIGGHQAFRLEVMKHLRLHRRLVVECTMCNQHFENDCSSLKHIVGAHPAESIRCRRVFIDDNNDIEKCELQYVLQCNMCGVRVETATKATEHFKLEHRSQGMEFIAIKMVKRTKDGTTSSFTPDERKVFNVWRTMVCNECDLPMKLKLDLFEHFNHTHPRQEIALRPGPINVKLCHIEDRQMDCWDLSDNLVFYCAHCYDQWTAVGSNRRAYTSIQGVHFHWQQVHSTMIETKPFRFYAIEFVQCVHCKFIGSFEAVKQHTKDSHPNSLLAISTVFDAKACALCPHVGGELGQHIKTEHELILRTNNSNPTRFTEDALKRLISQCVHTKYQCSNCDHELFDTKALAQIHSTMKHLNEPFRYTPCIEDNQIKLIAGCCEATLELDAFLSHLTDRNHQVISYCMKCNFRTSDLFEFVNHQVEVHQIMKDANLLFRRLMLTKFWSTKVMFGNGLVATKHNLLGTRYDDSTPFAATVEVLLTTSRERLQFNQLQKMEHQASIESI